MYDGRDNNKYINQFPKKKNDSFPFYEKFKIYVKLMLRFCSVYIVSLKLCFFFHVFFLFLIKFSLFSYFYEIAQKIRNNIKTWL